MISALEKKHDASSFLADFEYVNEVWISGVLGVNW